MHDDSKYLDSKAPLSSSATHLGGVILWLIFLFVILETQIFTPFQNVFILLRNMYNIKQFISLFNIYKLY